jgi:hypothetical protein
MSTDLHSRIHTLTETLNVLSSSLKDCNNQELHIAVRIAGRILNLFAASFDFSPAVDSLLNPKLNSMLIRQWSKSQSHLNAVRTCEIEIIELMQSCLEKRKIGA